MKFLVRRASTIYDDIHKNKPCEEAFMGKYTDTGYEAEGWFVEIKTLRELLKFQSKYGEIVIDDFPTPSILIYDDAWL